MQGEYVSCIQEVRLSLISYKQKRNLREDLLFGVAGHFRSDGFPVSGCTASSWCFFNTYDLELNQGLKPKF